MRILVLLLLALLAAHPASAATIVIDFEEEPAASYRDGTSFTSAECGCVVFTEGSPHGWLYVSEAVSTSESRVLIAGEEGGSLAMAFLMPVTYVALDFGNDQPDAESIGDAVLEGLIDGVVVVSASMTPNLNALVDQTLAISYEIPLTGARFRMPQSGEWEPTSPHIDNIVLAPEPAAFGFLLVLAVAAACARRRRFSLRARADARSSGKRFLGPAASPERELRGASAR